HRTSFTMLASISPHFLRPVPPATSNGLFFFATVASDSAEPPLCTFKLRPQSAASAGLTFTKSAAGLPLLFRAPGTALLLIQPFSFLPPNALPRFRLQGRLLRPPGKHPSRQRKTMLSVSLL